MMRFNIVAIFVMIMTSCANALTPAAELKCPCKASDTVVTGIIVERDTCVNQLKQNKEPIVKIRTVFKDGPPKVCGGMGPKILPVESEKCGDKLCLDSKAQVTLAANLAAYENWVRKVQECEKGE